MSQDLESQEPMTQGQFRLLHGLLLKMRGENERSHNELKEDIETLQDNIKTLGAHHGYTTDREGRLINPS